MLSKDELTTQFNRYFDDKNRISLRCWHKASVIGDYDFVIFVIRRSYVLALAMEKITGSRMKSDKTVYLTDGAAVNYCNYFAKCFVQNGTFPKMLLVDDILEYGRNINGVIGHLVAGIKRSLVEDNIILDEDDLYRELYRVVNINVLAKVSRKNLVLDYFRNSITTFSDINLRENHAVSSDISLFVNSTDIANASYIFTSRFKKDYVEGFKYDFLSTFYQGCLERAFIKYIKSDNNVHAIITLRFLKIKGMDCYRAIPFVIFPELTVAQRSLLIESLTNRIETGKYDYLNKDIFNANYYSERTINEWVIMIISNAILNEFRDSGDFKNPEAWEDIENEAHKLSRNYCRYGFEPEKAYNALIEIIKKPPVKNMDDIQKLLSSISIRNNLLFSISEQKTTIDKERVKTRIENLFYNFEIRDAREMYHLAEHNVYMNKPVPRKSIRKFSDVMNVIAEDLSYNETEYMTAYLLQMMDGGFINAAANSIISEAGSNYNAQIVRVAEQSSIIFPFRMRKYIPLIVDVWWSCKFQGVDFEDDLRSFGKSKYCDDETAHNIEQMIILTKILASIGETIDDVDINYFGRTEGYDDYDDFNSQINNMLALREYNNIRECYNQYKAEAL